MIPPPEIKREVPEPEAAAEAITDKSGFYSPAVMRLAMEHGVDLKAIKGTGEGGRVTKADVMRVLAEKKAGPEGIEHAAEGAGERGGAARRALSTRRRRRCLRPG